MVWVTDDPPRADGGRFCLRAAPAAAFTFEHCEYDADADELHLASGAECAASAETTPEGHIVRVARPDGHVCGLTLVGVSRLLHRDGHVRVTLCSTQQLVLSVAQLAPLLRG